MKNIITLPEIFKTSSNKTTFETEFNRPFVPADMQFLPLWFEKHSIFCKPAEIPEKYLFPYEPMISLSVKKNVVKRYLYKPNKMQGSIKEVINTNDWDISIIGSIIGYENGEPYGGFPIKDMEILREFLTSYPRVKVYNDFLLSMNITELVIESIEFPFVKGENVLAYRIQAISNMDVDILSRTKIQPPTTPKNQTNLLK